MSKMSTEEAIELLEIVQYGLDTCFKMMLNQPYKEDQYKYNRALLRSKRAQSIILNNK